jgi:hypothetical protein
MNREDHDFEQLRRLLKLKRYEKPPPRYFNDFSCQVVSRLEASRASAVGLSWWQRAWAGLELRPAVPVALSAAVCGLLVLGAVYSETAQVPEELLRNPSAQLGKNERPTVGLAAIGNTAPSMPVGFTGSSTNPLPGDSLFDRVPPYETWRAGHPLLRH